MKRRAVGFWTLALAAASVVLALHPIHESDPFFHVILGRLVLAHGSRVVPEPIAMHAFSPTCVAAAWFWSVLAYAAHQLGGWALLSWLAALLGGLVAWLVVRLIRQVAAPRSLGPLALVSGLVMASVLMRVRPRPQILFLVLLPAFLAVAYRVAQARGRALARWGAVLIGLELVWAQAHGSFVLAPGLFAIIAILAWRRAPTPERRRGLLLIFALLVAGLLTSAYGLGVGAYILHHSGGDAVRHIGEWTPPGWAGLDPTESPQSAALLALWTLSAAGMLWARRLWRIELSLALLGLLLASTAARFLAPAGILAAPLAGRAATALWDDVRPRGLAAVITALALLGLAVWIGRWVDRTHGPLGRVGVARDAQPAVAAAYLRRLPRGARVLTTYVAGAPIGFWTHGRARTFVDTRTPLKFDATDFGVARDVWHSNVGMTMGLRRYRPSAAVSGRDSDTCPRLAAHMQPVVVGPTYTTFRPAGQGRALRRLAACGSSYLTRDACADGGRALDSEIDRMAILAPTPFWSFLRAEDALRCRHEPLRAAALVPPRRAAWAYRKAWDRLAAAIRVARGDWPGALAILRPAIAKGDLKALRVIGRALVAHAPAELAAAVFQSAARALGDRTPGSLRADLAVLCLRAGELSCARFEAMRAAARGAKGALVPLRWLAKHAVKQRVRQDARGWIAIFGE